MIIDNPGIRALGLSGESEGVEQLFSDIEDLASECRFRDCAHRTEPGCAVLKAVEEGRIDAAHLGAYWFFVDEQSDSVSRATEKGRSAEARREGAAARRAREGIDDPDRSVE
jgi:ribosome biogenesis GTPase